MDFNVFFVQFISIVVSIILFLLLFYSSYLLIKALKKYINADIVKQIEKESKEKSVTLGDVLKRHRMECQMTQEFVSEALGISRQAVSKWESGKSDPSTTNLLALAKLFGVNAEDLLKEVQ